MIRRPSGEVGEALIETLITCIILGTSVVAVLVAMASSIAGSNQHRQKAQLEVRLGTAAEYVKSATTVACALNTTYSTGGVAGTSAKITMCSWAGNSALQLVTVTGTSPEENASLVVVKRYG